MKSFSKFLFCSLIVILLTSNESDGAFRISKFRHESSVKNNIGHHTYVDKIKGMSFSARIRTYIETKKLLKSLPRDRYFGQNNSNTFGIISFILGMLGVIFMTMFAIIFAVSTVVATIVGSITFGIILFNLGGLSAFFDISILINAIAVICGIIGIRRDGRRGLAIAGLVLGILGLGLLISFLF